MTIARLTKDVNNKTIDIINFSKNYDHVKKTVYVNFFINTSFFNNGFNEEINTILLEKSIKVNSNGVFIFSFDSYCEFIKIIEDTYNKSFYYVIVNNLKKEKVNEYNPFSFSHTEENDNLLNYKINKTDSNYNYTKLDNNRIDIIVKLINLKLCFLSYYDK